MYPDATHLGEVGNLPRPVQGLPAGRIQQIGQRRVCFHFVGGQFQRGELFGAGFNPTRRHQNRHVPMQHAGGFSQRRHAPKTAFEFSIGRH